jgi:hypothetical protein
MVGNKSDCSGRQVDNNEANIFAKENNMSLFETSAIFKNISLKLHNKLGDFHQEESKESIVNNLRNYLWNCMMKLDKEYLILLLVIAFLVIVILVSVLFVILFPFTVFLIIVLIFIRYLSR